MSEPLAPEQIAEIRQRVAGLDGWLENRVRQLIDDLEASRKERQELYAANHTWDATCDDLRVNPAQVKAERDTLCAQLASANADCNNWTERAFKCAKENAALRVRCEQLQRENQALVRDAEAGPTR